MMQLLERAIEIAAVAHRGGVRKNGEFPYILHPMDVVKQMANWGITDEITLCCGALHDVEEEQNDHRYMEDFLRIQPLGPSADAMEVYRIVCDELTYIPGRSIWKTKEEYIASFMQSSARGLAVKVADRLQNVWDFIYGNDNSYAVVYFQKGDPIFQAMILRKDELVDLYGRRPVGNMFRAYRKLHERIQKNDR